MKKSNAEILNHFYGLLIEINFHKPDNEVFEGKSYHNDPFMQKHLQQIKLQSAKYKIILNKNNYSNILVEIKRLQEIGFDEIRKLVSPQEAMQLQTLFSKFEELSQKDEISIKEDEELLRLINALKDKVDKSNLNE